MCCLALWPCHGPQSLYKMYGSSRGLPPFAGMQHLLYLDDSLITAAPSQEQPLSHLSLLWTCGGLSLVVNWENMQFTGAVLDSISAKGFLPLEWVMGIRAMVGVFTHNDFQTAGASQRLLGLTGATTVDLWTSRL